MVPKTGKGILSILDGPKLVGNLHGFFESHIGTLFQVSWAKNMLEHAIAPFCLNGG
jgi:hypothetical protein